MPELNFEILGAETVLHAAAPLLNFKLRITNSGGETIHSILLRMQVQLEVVRRRYEASEQEKLFELFGPPAEWNRTLRNRPWTHLQASVPGFTQSITVDLPVPCSFDFNLAATKYFDALEQGEVPLCFLFSGTVFHAAGNLPLQIMQIPWEKEATFQLPVSVWRQMRDHYYPDSAWLCLPRPLFEQLQRYKSRSALPTWELALEKLLAQAQAEEQVIP